MTSGPGAGGWTLLRDSAITLACLAAITAVCSAGLRLTNPMIPALAYLLAVLVAAALATLPVAIAGSLAAVLLLNYFFMAPVGTLAIAEPQNWVALAVMLAVSVIGSHLAISARAQASEASARRDELSRLFELSRDILMTTETDDAYGRLARSIADRFGLSYVAVCLPGARGWQLHEAGDGRLRLAPEQLETVLRAAQQTFDRTPDYEAAGRHTIHDQEGPPVHVVPLRLAGRPVGLLAIGGRAIPDATLDALIGIAAIAVERLQFLSEREAAELARHAAELKSALLDSLAHDLKTPLTAIRVAAGNLQAGWVADEERQAQSDIVVAEVERLARLFEHLVQMARIETKAVIAVPEWVTPGEIVEAASKHLQPLLADRQFAVVADDERAIHLDPRLTSAALGHLLENAAQYSPTGSTIAVRASATNDGFEVTVDDEGPGLAEAEIGQVFERFFRGRAGNTRPSGAGMGLAVARGLVAAQGGSVLAENRSGRGARFSIAIPAPTRDVVAEDEGAS
jgi:two-component system, OmpR family, sensor histidine kinase KdpD